MTARVKLLVRAYAPETTFLLAFVAWSALPLILFLPGHRGYFNGSDGIQVADHLQFMAWVRESGEHLLFSNRFDVAPDPRLFVHPMILLSGLAWRLGASIQLAYLAWKPIAVAALFVAFAAYVRRNVGDDRAARCIALGLALFFFTPAAALAGWLDASSTLQFGTLVVALETWVGGYVWGGFAGTVSVALVPAFLLGVGRLIETPGRAMRWPALLTGAAGLLATWLHPWQGLVILGIVGGLIVWGRFDRRYLNVAIPTFLTALPLPFYVALSRTNSSWAHAPQPSPLGHVGVWLLLALAPAVFALPGYRGPAKDVHERMLRLWPIAAIVVYFGLQQSWYYHAFMGISLPLAILAVRGSLRFPVPRTALVAAAVVVTAPGLVFAVQLLERTRDDHFFDPGEARALAYLDGADRPGPVLASLRLGNAVPAFTGRQTWVGHYTWTPDHDRRRGLTAALFEGRMPRAQARDVVAEAGTPFLLSSCAERADLRPVLGSFVMDVHSFSCATVYELREDELQQARTMKDRTAGR